MPLLIERIQEGTVIDRIQAFRGIRVLEILKLIPSSSKQGEMKARIALVINVPSHHMSRKDILKIEGRELQPAEVNKIALIAPQARLNVIRDGKVAKKQDVKLPAKLEDIAICPNPQCISRSERESSVFNNESGGLRCQYCERLFASSELLV